MSLVSYTGQNRTIYPEHCHVFGYYWSVERDIEHSGISPNIIEGITFVSILISWDQRAVESLRCICSILCWKFSPALQLMRRLCVTALF